MLIGAHIIIGAGIGAATGNPVAGFFAGAATHFIGDSIPHWEYSIDALSKLKPKKGLAKIHACFDPDIFWTLCLIAAEIAGAFTAVYFALRDPMTTQSLAAFAGGLGGLLPDVLWGLADNSDLFILKVYSRFHHAMHTRIKGASAIYTLTWQIAAAACALTILHA